MSANTLFDQPTTPRLHSVIQSINAGQLLFPEFQRPFIWKDEQRLMLLDSILSGLPIGSLLVWRTSVELAVKSKLGQFPLPPSAVGAPYSYVLDGMQRLSTLYAALAGGTAPPVDTGGRRWPIYYDLEESLDDGDQTRFKFARRDRRLPEEWLPLSAVFDGKALWTHSSRLYERGRDELAVRAEEFANRFKDYTLAVVPILTDDISRATQSFQRINSSGTPMSEVHMLRALVYADLDDLTRRFTKLGETLGWTGGVDHQALIYCLKAILGLSVYRSDLNKVATKVREDTTLLPRMEEGVRRAIDFYADACGVHSEAALPYTYQLVALARAAARGAHLATSPALKLWFWATTFTEYFTGKTAGQLRSAFEHVEAICVGGEPRPADLPDTVTPLTRFHSTSVRALALMHLLSWRRLINFEGQPVHGPRLVARGSETFAKMCLDLPADDPANRLLVAPEEAAGTREVLFDHDAPISPALREAHLLPPWDHPASASIDTTLSWRRNKLRELETTFIKDELNLRVAEDDASPS